MLTDAPPRKKHLASFLESDRLKDLPLLADGRLPRIAALIETRMKTGGSGDVGGPLRTEGLEAAIDGEVGFAALVSWSMVAVPGSAGLSRDSIHRAKNKSRFLTAIRDNSWRPLTAGGSRPGSG